MPATWRATSTSSMAESRPAADTREADRHGRPFFWGAAYGNGSAMFFDDLFHGRKTQAGSGSLCGKERLKNLVDDLCRDGSPVVLDENLVFNAAPGPMLSDLDRQVSSRSHGLAGILEDT